MTGYLDSVMKKKKQDIDLISTSSRSAPNANMRGDDDDGMDQEDPENMEKMSKISTI
jgi:hypothetical protein